ncbi:mechanosensitive ion channel family protein [Flexithrix dorotheae]|uniref:mechanosensitive ion channel family protein n=1 Tax=Flexithrix dorotheae TaxID=70993 RepID=UPI00037A5F37|nr:mechanosensitive ion channel domain-containing protein [Flexithrix dorotheae]
MIDQLISSFRNFQEAIIQGFPSFIVGVTLLVFFIIIGSLIRSYTKRKLLKKVKDKLLVNFIGRIIFLSMLVIGVVIFLNQVGLGKAAGGLLAGAGVSAIVIGFAFKDIGENFLAGFFLAFSRPFSIGDVVEVEGIKGKVKSLSFRNTHIRTFDGRDIFVPNAILIKHPLVNFTRDGLLRYDFTIGLDYGDDIPKAVSLIKQTLEKETKIEHGEALKPFILLEEFSTSTINLRIFFWVNSFNYQHEMAVLRTEIMNNILVSLAKNGFSMPADIVELKIYQEGQPIPLKMQSQQLHKTNQN